MSDSSWQTQVNMTLDQAIGTEPVDPAELEKRQIERTYDNPLLLSALNQEIDEFSFQGNSLEHWNMHGEILINS